jgi:hypothetical protein
MTRKIFDRSDFYLHFTGNSHPDNCFPKKIAGHVIINHNNAGRPDGRYPGFKDLAMNQPVVHTYERYIHKNHAE